MSWCWLVADTEQIPCGRKRKNRCWTPFLSFGGPNGTTERAQIQVLFYGRWDITVDRGGHLLRTNTLLLCRGLRKRLSFVLIRLASCPRFWTNPNTVFYLGTERTAHEQPRSVPSGSTRSNRKRHALTRPLDRATAQPFVA